MPTPPRPTWRSTKAPSPKPKRTPPPKPHAPVRRGETRQTSNGDVTGPDDLDAAPSPAFSEVSYFGAVQLHGRAHLRSVASVPTAGLVWVGDDRGTITAHDSVTGSQTRQANLDAGSGPINCLVAVHTAVWAGCGSGAMLIFDGSTGELLARLRGGHKKSVLCAIFDESCEAVVSGGVDHSVAIWSAVKRALVVVVDTGRWAVTSLTSFPAAVFPDVAFATGSERGEVTLWDNDNNVAGECLGHEDAVLTMIVVDTPNAGAAAELWSGSADGSVRIWDVDGRTCATTLTRHEGAVLSLLHNKDEPRVWSCGTDGLVVAWDVGSRAPMCSLAQQDAAVCAVSVARATVWRLWVCGEDGTAQCYLTHSAALHAPQAETVGPAEDPEQWRTYAEECMSQIQAQHLEIKDLHKALQEEGERADSALARLRERQEHSEHCPTVVTTTSSTLCDIEALEEGARSLLTDAMLFARDQWLLQLGPAQLRRIQLLESEYVACRNERDHFQELVRAETSKAPSHGNDEHELQERIADLEAALTVSQSERQLAVRELHECQSEVLTLRHSSAELNRLQLEDFRRQNDSLRESMRVERQAAEEREDALRRSKEQLDAQVKHSDSALEESKRSVATLNNQVADLRKALEQSQQAIASAKADVAKTTELEHQLDQQRRQTEALHKALASMELDAQEMRLAMEQQRHQNEEQVQRLQSDLLSMRTPWETMKRALSESRGALEQAKRQFVGELQQLETEVEKRNRELAVLKRALATLDTRTPAQPSHPVAHATSRANNRAPHNAVVERLQSHVRNL